MRSSSTHTHSIPVIFLLEREEKKRMMRKICTLECAEECHLIKTTLSSFRFFRLGGMLKVEEKAFFLEKVCQSREKSFFLSYLCLPRLVLVIWCTLLCFRMAEPIVGHLPQSVACLTYQRKAFGLLETERKKKLSI